MFPEQYTSVEKISQGGSAEVYRAVVKGSSGLSDFERTVALKRILPAHVDRVAHSAMLIHEAKLLVSLSHPNIVRVYDLGCNPDGYFVVMEYVDGCDLRRVMRHYNSLTRDAPENRPAAGLVPLEYSILIIAEICKALEYAHNKIDELGRPLHLVHLDLSPKNILISRSGEVKLTDFGIASIQNQTVKIAAGPKEGNFRIIRGKFGYMSPEQALGWPVDATSDMFSLGLVLYELLTAERLYKSDTLHALQREHVERQAAPPLLPPTVPAELEYIVLKCLAWDPEDRYASASALREDLLHFLVVRLGEIPHQQLVGMIEELLGKVAAPITPPKLSGLAESESSREEDSTLQARSLT